MNSIEFSHQIYQIQEILSLLEQVRIIPAEERYRVCLFQISVYTNDDVLLIIEQDFILEQDFISKSYLCLGWNYLSKYYFKHKNIDVCETLMPPFPNMTFDLDL